MTHSKYSRSKNCNPEKITDCSFFQYTILFSAYDVHAFQWSIPLSLYSSKISHPLHPAMLRSIPLRYISLYGCRRISLKITKPSVENTSVLPDGFIIFILAWLVAYSNSFSGSVFHVTLLLLRFRNVSF